MRTPTVPGCCLIGQRGTDTRPPLLIRPGNSFAKFTLICCPLVVLCRNAAELNQVHVQPTGVPRNAQVLDAALIFLAC